MNAPTLALATCTAVLLCQCSQPALTGVRITGQDGPSRGLSRPMAAEPLRPDPAPSVRPVEESPRSVSHVETGKSSWYSVKTNGGTETASGIPFSDHKYTVAHRTLAFGTQVRVTNLNNGKSVVGTVTDRGPFIAGRIVDLSLPMAKKIEAYRVGVAPCRLEVLGR